MKYEKFEKGADIRDLAKTARALGIPYVGLKAPELLPLVNDKIEKINSGEIENPKQVKVKKTINEDGEEVEVMTRQKSPKWYEEEGAFPYKEGDVFQIVSGPILIGRKASVVMPSAKKNALKGRLINPSTGELQKTQVNFKFSNIKLIERDGQPVNEEDVM